RRPCDGASGPRRDRPPPFPRGRARARSRSDHRAQFEVVRAGWAQQRAPESGGLRYVLGSRLWPARKPARARRCAVRDPAESQVQPYRTYGSRLRHRPQSTAKAYWVSVELRTMRFPSIGSAILEAGAGARRFPWTLAASLVATGAAMTAIAGPERVVYDYFHQTYRFFGAPRSPYRRRV